MNDAFVLTVPVERLSVELRTFVRYTPYIDRRGKLIVFMGHYAAAPAGKAFEQRAPLWSYIAAADVLDIIRSDTIIARMKWSRFKKTLPGAPLIMDYMPWTHSYPAAIASDVEVFQVAGRLFRRAPRAALALSLVTFSHFPLNYIVNRPDLTLGLGAPKAGLAPWNRPALEEIVEIGCLAFAAAVRGWRRGLLRLPAAGALGCLALLVAVQFLPVTASLIADPVGFGVFGLVIYFGLTAVATLIDQSNNGDNRDAA